MIISLLSTIKRKRARTNLEVPISKKKLHSGITIDFQQDGQIKVLLSSVNSNFRVSNTPMQLFGMLHRFNPI